MFSFINFSSYATSYRYGPKPTSHNEIDILFEHDGLKFSSIKGKQMNDYFCKASLTIIIPKAQYSTFNISLETMLPVIKHFAKKWRSTSETHRTRCDMESLPREAQVMVNIYFEDLYIINKGFHIGLLGTKEDIGSLKDNKMMSEMPPVSISYYLIDGKVVHRSGKFGKMKELFIRQEKYNATKVNDDRQIDYAYVMESLKVNELRYKKRFAEYYKGDLGYLSRKEKERAKELKMLGAPMEAFYEDNDLLKYEIQGLLRALFTSDTPETYFSSKGDEYRRGYTTDGFEILNSNERFEMAVWGYIFSTMGGCANQIPGGLSSAVVTTTNENTGGTWEETIKIPNIFFRFVEIRINLKKYPFEIIRSSYGRSTYVKALKKVIQLRGCKAMVTQYHNNLMRVKKN